MEYLKRLRSILRSIPMELDSHPREYGLGVFAYIYVNIIGNTLNPKASRDSGILEYAERCRHTVNV